MDLHPLIPIVRYLNIALLVAAIIYWGWLCIKCKTSGFIAPISWLIDVLAFYVFRVIVLENPTQQNIDAINLWSSLVIGHGILLLLLTAWLVRKKVCDEGDKLPEEMEKEIRKKMIIGRNNEWKQ